MSTRALIVSAAVLTFAASIAAAPVPKRPELAPPPRVKTTAPWERTDLRPPKETEAAPRDEKNFAMAFLDYAELKDPELSLKLCLPGTVTVADVEKIRAAKLPRSNVRAVLVSERGTEVVAITEEAELMIGGKKVAGHVAVTLVRDDKRIGLVKAVHIGDAATLKPLLDAFYEARPDLRPKKR